MATAKSLLGSLLRVLNKRQASPEDADKARRVEQARREYEQRLEDDRRELDWRRGEEQRELVEGLRQTEVPESSDPAIRWAESGAWHDVSSSNVKSIRYDQDQEELQIEYKDASVYGYKPVSTPMAVSFFNAPSSGKWVWSELRVRGKGNKFNYRVPYYLFSGPSRTERKWMATEESRRQHGLRGRLIRKGQGK